MKTTDGIQSADGVLTAVHKSTRFLAPLDVSCSLIRLTLLVPLVIRPYVSDAIGCCTKPHQCVLYSSMGGARSLQIHHVGWLYMRPPDFLILVTTIPVAISYLSIVVIIIVAAIISVVVVATLVTYVTIVVTTTIGITSPIIFNRSDSTTQGT